MANDCWHNVPAPNADSRKQHSNYECSYNTATSLIQMRHRKPRRCDDQREKASEGSSRKCAGEYSKYEPTIHKFFRQPGSARQCHKGEGLAGALRHDFLRELK